MLLRSWWQMRSLKAVTVGRLFLARRASSTSPGCLAAFFATMQATSSWNCSSASGHSGSALHWKMMASSSYFASRSSR